jgi:peptidoglycan hydrolase-like protein with peptidoglycan-binding domain
MDLRTFYQASRAANGRGDSFSLSPEGIAADNELATNIQQALISLGLLSPPADGRFGPISTAALLEFQSLLGRSNSDIQAEQGSLGWVTAKALIETSLQDINALRPPIDLSGNDLATKVIKYMQQENYRVSTGDKRFNIVYIEGMSGDGELNDDRPNEFNDCRMVIEIPSASRRPRVVNSWQATTEPGYYYTNNPISAYARRMGAARIAFGQYKAWQVGTHGNAEPHEALIQCANVSVYRDRNRDMMRTGDFLDTGSGFGINQHYGYDYPRNNIGMASAGCLVGRMRQGHREFMSIVKSDARYQSNSSYIFETTIIAGDQLGA